MLGGYPTALLNARGFFIPIALSPNGVRIPEKSRVTDNLILRFAVREWPPNHAVFGGWRWAGCPDYPVMVADVSFRSIAYRNFNDAKDLRLLYLL